MIVFKISYYEKRSKTFELNDFCFRQLVLLVNTDKKVLLIIIISPIVHGINQLSFNFFF